MKTYPIYAPYPYKAKGLQLLVAALFRKNKYALVFNHLKGFYLVSGNNAYDI